jgi:hypothetical protein
MYKMTLQILVLVIGLFSSAEGEATDVGSLIQGDEPILHIEKFGRGNPVSVSNGYLFIDFKYVAPPYVIERVGQAVTVNHIIVNCLYTNAIPDTFERQISEISDSDGRMHTVRSPPHPASWIKGTADAHVSWLSNLLNRAAVFLPGPRPPLIVDKNSSQWAPRNVPVITKIYSEKFPRALLSAVSATREGDSWKSAKEICTSWSLSEIETRHLVDKAKGSPILMERLHAEVALAALQKQPAEPSYARLATYMSVVSATAYQWKLTILFDNGLEFYVGRDMEIRDILFATNAITVEAYRDDIRFPLPETKRIRVAPKLQATIKSCNTGQTCTATITDAVSKTICLDDVKYQVIDIRADAKTVLLKNLKTGERLLVVPDKDLTKADSP